MAAYDEILAQMSALGVSTPHPGAPSITWALSDNGCYATATAEVFGAKLRLEAFKVADALPTRHMRAAGYWSYAGKDEDMVDSLLRHVSEADLREGRYNPCQIEGLTAFDGGWLLFAEPAGGAHV